MALSQKINSLLIVVILSVFQLSSMQICTNRASAIEQACNRYEWLRPFQERLNNPLCKLIYTDPRGRLSVHPLLKDNNMDTLYKITSATRQFINQQISVICQQNPSITKINIDALGQSLAWMIAMMKLADATSSRPIEQQSLTFAYNFISFSLKNHEGSSISSGSIEHYTKQYLNQLLGPNPQDTIYLYH